VGALEQPINRVFGPGSIEDELGCVIDPAPTRLLSEMVAQRPVFRGADDRPAPVVAQLDQVVVRADAEGHAARRRLHVPSVEGEKVQWGTVHAEVQDAFDALATNDHSLILI
jgi:hypothetical protein